ncbi:MAG: hypothetical protein LBE12_07625 [Planctomycetaceae bacterium]|jgi:hypothetical protein|nr:hypothetical protein [Planctomycetaceae bacterium]
MQDRRKVKTPSQICHREITYLSSDEIGISERGDVVIYDQKGTVEGVKLPAEMEKFFNNRYKVSFDGAVLEPVLKDVPLCEVSPRYPSTLVGDGSMWVQTLLVDPRLNLGGSVKQKFEVLKTYVKDNERFMRISSDITYWSYQPVEDNISGSISYGGNTENTIRLRNIGISDFNVDRGIDTFSRGIQMIYSEKSPCANDESAFIITFTETTLVSMA